MPFAKMPKQPKHNSEIKNANIQTNRCLFFMSKKDIKVKSKTTVIKSQLSVTVTKFEKLETKMSFVSEIVELIASGPDI